ncbi:MAG: hypothetical protein FJ319_14000 [SAR202 cluster bacterium]|nr:hypothetical protein [SAR202 cluster bacterium]
MGITVIPAYRVVARLAKQARTLPFEEGLNVIESGTREYVRSLFSLLHPSIMDLGERTAITQLGDPAVDELIDAIAQIEEGSPKELAEATLAECSRHISRPDLVSKVVLLPGDGQSRVLVNQMNGVLGFSMGSQAMALFLWPAEGWQRWLAYTIAHEYFHLVRNLLFPRSVTGGKLVFVKSKEAETLLDAMIVEGMADTFAMKVCPDIRPAWIDAIRPDDEAYLWPRIHRRLAVSNPGEVRRLLFGDNDRIPPWTGYTLGYRMVQKYLQAYPETALGYLVTLPADQVYASGGYAPPPSS